MILNNFWAFCYDFKSFGKLQAKFTTLAIILHFMMIN